MKQTLPYRIILVCTLLWCAFLFLAPLLAAYGNEIISTQVYKSYSHICHQYDSRSLDFLGHPLAVCARCSAIYFGFLAGILLFPLAFKHKNIKTIKYLLVALAPMLVDVVSDAVGLHTSNLFTRLVTGSFFGIISAFVLSPLIIEALSEIIIKQSNNQKAKYEFKT